jgi:hypothetical protein
VIKSIIEKFLIASGIIIVSLVYALLTGTLVYWIWLYVQPIFFPSVPVQFQHPSWMSVIVLMWLIEELGVAWRGKRG